ncbi:MAG: peroxidase family protein [Planctomycetota bacterium]
MKNQPFHSNTRGLGSHPVPAFFGKVSPSRSISHEGDYGRLFRSLPPYDLDNGKTVEDLVEKIKILKDDEATKSAETMPAAYISFGQLVAHDLTFDPTTINQRGLDPDRTRNFRTPRFDLDCVYGRGPAVEPHLYSFSDSLKRGGVDSRGFYLDYEFRHRTVEANDPESVIKKFGPKANLKEADLPRNQYGIASIPDPRNDADVIISQLHLAIIKFHNKAMDYSLAHQQTGWAAFENARRITRWHYQWVVLRDYLGRLTAGTKTSKGKLGPAIQTIEPEKYRAQLRDWGMTPRLYQYKKSPFLPIEFSAAVFRFGHSTARVRSQLNGYLPAMPQIAESGPSMQGGREIRRWHSVAWNWFLQSRDNPLTQLSHPIGPHMSKTLSNLPHGIGSLAKRDIERSLALALPSGQAIARRLNVSTIWNSSYQDNLWYYILEEAKFNGNGGRRLGPVGARIMIEVFVGILESDPTSFLAENPSWHPHLGFGGLHFDLLSFLKVAEMPMTDDDVFEDA